MSDRTCIRCGIPKDPSEFRMKKRLGRNHGSLSFTCRPCLEIKNRSKHFRRYGITLEEYDELLEKQNGLCAVCGLPPIIGFMGSTDDRPFDIDHDHDTKEVRGLVHRKCNLIIGLAGDNVEILKEAINYLERHKIGLSYWGDKIPT